MKPALVALFVSSALMTAAVSEASAVSTLVAADRLGAALGGLPNTAAVAGTGAGALALSRIMAAHGRRRGLLIGYAAALLGAGLATVAVPRHDIALLVAGMTLLGFGNAGANLSRYAAADLYPDRPGTAIGAVVWAGTVGAVGGPLLMLPAQHAAAGAGWDPMSGPFLLAAIAVGGALLVAVGTPRIRPERTVAYGRPFRSPAVRSAAATMVTAQVVMAAVVTAAPLSMHLHHQDLGAIGTMLSAHTLGMFALAPASGWLLDRVGGRAVMTAGLATMAGSACLVATAPSQAVLIGILFLLGYGWNLCLVGGSGVLTRQLPGAGATRAQGAVEATSWGTSTLATTASTLMFVHDGYPMLAIGAASLCILPLLALPGPNLGRRVDVCDRDAESSAGTQQLAISAGHDEIVIS
ncbi:MAG TPA: MFS transporter [Jatrophihabitantaceae bacterium]